MLLLKKINSARSTMGSFLKEQSAAPEFTATAYNGEAVALSGLIADGPAVLSFLRSLD